MSKTPKAPRIKPQKPYPDFPLFPHDNGQWAKKVGPKHYYFGPWDDWQNALKRYHAFLKGPPDTLRQIIDRFLEDRRRLIASKDMTARHVKDLEATLNRLADCVGPSRSLVGLKSEDFGIFRAKLAETCSPVTIGNHVIRLRSFLNWCVAEKLLSEIPACNALKKPTRSVLRLERAKRGSRMYTPKEIQLLLRCASPQMKAMILLALNCGLGNEDIARLTTNQINGKWLDYPRRKTGIERRVPLWPETRNALAAVIRPGDEVVFRTCKGNLWIAKSERGTDSPISAQFGKFCRDLEIDKKGRGFYSLRHVCETVGGETGDQVAIDYIMGHSPDSDDMSAVYRERMEPSRLFKVVKHIRRWALTERKVETTAKVEKSKPNSTPESPACQASV